MVDAHIDIISGLPTFSGVGAGIAHHKSFEVDLSFSFGQFVFVDDLMSQVRNVNSCVALSSDVELVIFQGWEFCVKGLKSFVVVLGHSSIVSFGASF